MTNAKGTGWSANLSFEEALKEAIDDLAFTPAYPDEQLRAVISESGVELGGISGRPRLFVTIAPK